MTNFFLLYVSFMTILIFIEKVDCLECYVCDQQEDNTEKCVKTIKICDYSQDVCLTEIKWGSTPYWDQNARKQYYISKRCSNKTECAAIKQYNMQFCTHLWYQDWQCSDCCQGDRCNYYIISAATRPIFNIMTIIMSLLTLSVYGISLGI